MKLNLRETKIVQKLINHFFETSKLKYAVKYKKLFKP